MDNTAYNTIKYLLSLDESEIMNLVVSTVREYLENNSRVVTTFPPPKTLVKKGESKNEIIIWCFTIPVTQIYIDDKNVLHFLVKLQSATEVIPSSLLVKNIRKYKIAAL
jgi:hypothetical protein